MEMKSVDNYVCVDVKTIRFGYFGFDIKNVFFYFEKLL